MGQSASVFIGSMEGVAVFKGMEALRSSSQGDLVSSPNSNAVWEVDFSMSFRSHCQML